MENTKRTIKTLQNFTKFGSFLGVFPLKVQFRKSFQVESKPTSDNVKFFWCFVSLSGIILSFVETTAYLKIVFKKECSRDLKQNYLIPICNSGFDLLAKVACFHLYLLFAENCKDFKRLTNNLFRLMLEHVRKGELKLFVFTFVFIHSAFLIFLLGAPLIDLFLPQLRPFWLSKKSSILPQIVLAGVDFLCFLPVALIATHVSTLSSLTIYHVILWLQELRTDLASNSPWILFNVDSLYKEIQIFVEIANICFQNGVVPWAQFGGSLAIISFLYTFIMFGKILSKWTLFGMIVMSSVVTGFCLLVLELGSRPRLLSRRILLKWRKVQDEANLDDFELDKNKIELARSSGSFKKDFNRITQRLIRSSPLISFRLGPFHNLDRSRGPALIKFCLQRTAFLIFNTKA